MEKLQIIVHKERCIGCGLCARVCVAHNISMLNQKAATKLNDCVLCGQCTAVCPQKAIVFNGYDTEPPEKQGEIHLNPQEVLEVIRFRRSIRQFKNQQVPREIIHQILEAGRLTHTAKNMQDVSFAVLEERKEKVEELAVRFFRRIKPLADLLSPMTRQNQIDQNFFFFGAPVVIVIFAKDKTNGILAAQNMEFVAEAHGLGVLFSGYFTTAANLLPKVKKILKVPPKKHVAMTLVIGYPDVKYLRAVPRKKLDVQYM